MADTSKLIVELVKSQIQIERQLKQDVDLEQNLDLLKQKYDWIIQDQSNNAFQPQKIQPKIKIINKSTQQQRIEQQKQKLNKNKSQNKQIQQQVQQTQVKQEKTTQVQQKQQLKQQPKQQVQQQTQPKQQQIQQQEKQQDTQQIQQQQPLTKNNNQLPPEYDDQPQNLVQCEYCGRKFSADRIEKHHKVCTKNPSHKKIVAKTVKQEFKTGLE